MVSAPEVLSQIPRSTAKTPKAAAAMIFALRDPRARPGPGSDPGV